MSERSRVVTFGSAQLLGPGGDPVVARAVLEAAVGAGAGRLDTAPSYGAGACEGLVADVLRSHRHVLVTTKVGLEPRPHPPGWRVAAGRVLARTPEDVRALLRRARGDAPVDGSAPSGRFGVEAVRASLRRSLTLFDEPVDRLVLHEVLPADVDGALLEELGALLASGSVRQVGCATRNRFTAEVLRRGRGLLTAAHVSAAPLGPEPPELPEGVTAVHHGLLGPGGADLDRLAVAARGGSPEALAWRDAAAAAGLGGRAGLAEALVRRGAGRGADEVIVATSRPDRAPGVVAAALSGAAAPALAQALDRLVGAVDRRAVD